MAGSANSHIATLVERQTRYLLLVKVPGKGSARVVDALVAQIPTLPRQLWASLTWDRGVELAAHRRFTIATDVAVYFCDPRSPWQRGTNENTNGLLRQYFPKWTDLSGYSQADLDAVADPTQRTAPQDARLPDPGRYAGGHRCVDPLNPPLVSERPEYGLGRAWNRAADADPVSERPDTCTRAHRRVGSART